MCRYNPDSPEANTESSHGEEGKEGEEGEKGEEEVAFSGAMLPRGPGAMPGPLSFGAEPFSKERLTSLVPLSSV
jgi:hypothetical protein